MASPRRAIMILTPPPRRPPPRRPPLLLYLGVLASIAACQADPPIFERDASREVAVHYCAELFACQCLDPAGFASEEACVANLSGDLLGEQLEVVTAGLTYDPSCVDARIDDIAALGCSRDPARLETCSDCFAYHGAVPQDGPCRHHGAFSDCDQGLVCITREAYDGDPVDVCAPACLREGTGEPCSLEGPGFHVLRDCDDGLFCDARSTGRCTPLPEPGLPCAMGSLCSGDAWCDASVDPSICAALKTDGDGCASDLECASTWCDYGGRCRPPIAEGVVCVFDRDRCAPGLNCTEAMPFCAPTDALQCQGPPTSL